MNKYLIILLSLIVFSACEDYLDKKPNDEPLTQGYFISEKAAQESRIGIYARRIDAFTDEKYQWDCITDQLYAQHNWGAATSIYRGVITPETGGLVSNFYGGAYSIIAVANDHIANVEEMDSTLFEKLPKERYLADARFFKAFYYFYLTECYGGVPLYKHRMETIDEYKIKQSEKSEIVEYILGELELAIKVLPEESYKGYITKGAAQALKAKILLHNNRWEEAADVAEAVIKSGKFRLDPDYFDLFIKKGQTSSTEIIYASEFQYPEVAHSLTRWLVNSAGGTPRQEFVDSYLMADGLEAGESLLDSSAYKNRDPRLYLTVRMPDDIWLDKEGVPVPFEQTQTGYYIKKFFDEDITDVNSIRNLETSEQSIIHLRYADVLLMYAEAKFRLNQFDQSIYEQTIELIRKRVGMGNVDVTTMSDPEKFKLIRYERSIELAFEGHRYFDLKRWDLLKETILSLTDPVGGSIRWEDHFMLWPFSSKERNLNPNLEQNFGYRK